MKTPRRHSLLAAIAAGALLATAFTAAADPAPKRDDDRQEQRKDRREQHQERRQDRREAKQERRQERREDRRDARQEHREDRREARQERHDDRRNVRASIARQQASQRAYRQRLDAERARRQAAQRRAYAYANARHYAAYAPSHRYRYSYGGRWHDTSHYGAAMLRRAVERGYQEGMRAGRSDRYDRYGRYDHRRSRMWIDASEGFGGRYVSRSDYAHFFRQGFQRGYEDGFYGHQRYGRRIDGDAVIIQAVLEAILGFQRLG